MYNLILNITIKYSESRFKREERVPGFGGAAEKIAV